MYTGPVLRTGRIFTRLFARTNKSRDNAFTHSIVGFSVIARFQELSHAWVTTASSPPPSPPPSSTFSRLALRFVGRKTTLAITHHQLQYGAIVRKSKLSRDLIYFPTPGFFRLEGKLSEISRYLDFIRELMEDGACCDGVSDEINNKRGV